MTVTPLPSRGAGPVPGRGTGTLSGQAPRRRRAPSQAGILRRRIMVNLTKWILPACGLGLLASIVLWPQIDRMSASGRMAFRRLGLTDTGQARVVDARYRGVNEKNEPYTITAATATQVKPDRVDLVTPKADLTMQSGAWLMLQSEQGVFMQKANLLDLSGHVVLYRDDGTTLNTAATTIDLTQGAAASNVPVHAEGPFGTLDAQGYALTDKGDTIQFTGPARLVLNSADQ
jgi:lipopolysaccharide export system protein LptC